MVRRAASTACRRRATASRPTTGTPRPRKRARTNNNDETALNHALRLPKRRPAVPAQHACRA
eukprot:5448005-Prymnesium_polylepis.1